jgi:hypothetical protein
MALAIPLAPDPLPQISPPPPPRSLLALWPAMARCPPLLAGLHVDG